MRDVEVGGGLVVSVVVRWAACWVGLVAEAAPGAGGDLEGTSMGREDGFVSVLGGTVAGG